MIESITDWLKQLFNSLTLRSLGFIAFSATIILGFASWNVEDDWSSAMLASLSTTALGILITVFFVDRIIESHENKRWSRLRDLSSMEIRHFCGRSIYLLVQRDPVFDRYDRFRYAGDVLRSGLRGSHWSLFFEREGWREHVTVTMQGDMKNFLWGREPVDGSERTGIIEYSHSWAHSVLSHLGETLQLFSTALEPNQLALLIRIRGILRKIEVNGPWEHGEDDAAGYTNYALKLMIELLDTTPYVDWHRYYFPNEESE